MPVHKGQVLLHILLYRRGLRIFSGQAGAPEHIFDRMERNVCKQNDVVKLDDLVRALVDEWKKLESRFLRKLVQGMP